jgi:hypothetical protein
LLVAVVVVMDNSTQVVMVQVVAVVVDLGLRLPLALEHPLL